MRFTLKTVFDSDQIISIFGKARLRHLHQRFQGIPLVHTYVGGPSVSVADGGEMNLTQQTRLLTTYIMTPWAPVGICLAVAILQGGGDALILGSKLLRKQLHIVVMDGLWVRAQGQSELQESGSTWNTEKAPKESMPHKEQIATTAKGEGVGQPCGCISSEVDEGTAGQRNPHSGKIEATGTSPQRQAALLPTWKYWRRRVWCTTTGKQCT